MKHLYENMEPNHEFTNHAMEVIVINPNDYFNTQQWMNQRDHKNPKDTIVHQGKNIPKRVKNIYIYIYELHVAMILGMCYSNNRAILILSHIQQSFIHKHSCIHCILCYQFIMLSLCKHINIHLFKHIIFLIMLAQ